MIDLVTVNDTLINLADVAEAYDAGYVTLADDTGLMVNNMRLFVAHGEIYVADGLVMVVVCNGPDNMNPERVVALDSQVMASAADVDKYLASLDVI